MPLLARRYRFMHAISETDLSQVICATDTYCECERAADGRRQPLVAIKVLNAKHWILGAQEYTRMRLLRKRQDAEGVHVPIAGATSCFEVGCHFCILQPLLATLDHEAARCRLCGPPGGGGEVDLGNRVRLIDFSNAMTPAESKAYYDTFDVQTLGYRAQEVIFGAPFGFGIDMWSLGVTLCELFAGRYLLQAASRGGLAVQVAQLLGRPPQGLFDGAKYHAELHHLVAHQPPPLPPTQLRARLTERLGAPRSSQAQLFLDLVTGMLQYDPRRRLTPSEALCHPFLAHFFPWRATMPREVVAAADEKVFVEMRGPALDVQPEEPPLKKRLVGGRPLDAVTQIA
ncbi:hypothetical protein EMIHUDRAFT_447845 [Emiliania huxleyi CCMP1516]|uniref:Protein kinase domain-containing protein n=2 Tax=Emiliania huxleyi TaxID=2903 RepID=A0A0D3JI15_EMIH1|nr:hypothetical protein EMIHUDRAFT_447845 [Emiliania huxleyi CCMP1516]EOD23150.1 hypothetical protein EMIHUDRAFT_447845 [Emiliania huxleyi CCMP1516]|eukprot:XP_005775579.1 hypothetical protein EMIHUDRAFT_447845 [Emiliania huxleyi CCMP1516]